MWSGSRIDLICTLGFIASLVLNIAEADDELLRQLKRDIPLIQRDYRRNLVSGTSCRSHYDHYSFSSEQKRVRSWRNQEFALQFPWETIEELDGGTETGDNTAPRKSGELIRACNGKYAFQLIRSTGAEAWRVSAIDTSDPTGFLHFKGKYEGRRTLSIEESMALLIPVLDIEGVPIDRLLADDGVKLTSAERTDDDRVWVKFTGSIDGVLGGITLIGGDIWLSPKHQWGVDEFKVDYRSEEELWNIRQKAEWSEVDGIPVPSAVNIRYTRSDPSNNESDTSNNGGEYRYLFSDWKRGPIKEERFRLSYYGLSEPGLAGENRGGESQAASSRRLLVWFNVIGIVLIVIAVLLRRKSLKT